MKRAIRKVAVLGSGVMGSAIAAHFANIGCKVLLLDIVPDEAKDSKNKSERNAIVDAHLKASIKSKPAPLYSKKFASRIETGNFDDDMPKIKDYDWVIEVVIERLDIKKIIFEQVEKYRTPGTLITSNTSGIPIHLMLDGRSDDFKAHFCGTHFFNPPRYLKLLEIIPTPHTQPEVVDFLMGYGKKILGKTTVLCKDTPAFIANRIGVFAIMALFHSVKDLDLSVDEVDKLTGPVLGRPKSATFRTADVVGLDTLVLVANGLKENTPNDEANALFTLPDYVGKMIDNKWLGSKTKQGFYKKVKDENGKSQILSLNLKTLEYEPKQRVKFPTLEMTKTITDLAERMPVLFNGKDKAGEFYRSIFTSLFAYVTHRIPEISDEVFRMDDALRAGFGWQQGPFEAWDAIGFEAGLRALEKADKKPADWIYEMKEAGFTAFYKVENGKRFYYDIPSKSYVLVPGQEDTLSLALLREENTLWKNREASIIDLGDGVINLEFHSKMNTIGGEVIAGINKAIDMAEADYDALVISNEGENFSAGANVGMIFMMAVEQEYDELDFAIRSFQNTVMRIRYSSIPVVVAPHGMALGGGCEISMHADKVIAHAETYIGLVEFGVGLIPGGGGSKEFVLRMSDELKEGDIRTNQFRNRFLTIGQAKVATSAYEGFELGYLREGIDEVIVSRDYHLAYAKQAAKLMAEKGYTQPTQRTDIKVYGQEALGLVYSGANSMLSGNYMSEHDELISIKLGTVLAGGDLSETTEVSEQYLLDLERRAFLELCTERKTLERIQSIVTKGKILRN
ncbi:3-hydroxyacyl-CoA dehydrogenase/enoyl-CoA hydratase family protein [bacterium SCSIO 12643]|nr:3-hydroxyacyl-CoA dehydrogenase/enoyl-CoA hydratase family protein [bacterium SCSIO 12643]